MQNIEPSSQNIEGKYSNNLTNNPNYESEIIIIQKPIYIDEYFNQNNFRQKPPIILETNNKMDNDHINERKIFEKNALINNNVNNDFTKELNSNILNHDFQQKNNNLHPKIIVQKIMNKENRQKNFQDFPEDNKILSNKLNDTPISKGFSEKKSNYQYIIKNVKKINQPLKKEKNVFNDISEYQEKKVNEMNINHIREELKLIHDNRKYNYDNKVQRINPAKINIPVSQKLVERMLGLSENKQTQEKKEKKITPVQPYELINNQKIINIKERNITPIQGKIPKVENDDKEIDVANSILRQNIKINNYHNNHIKNNSKIIQNQINQNNNQNITPPQNLHINNKDITNVNKIPQKNHQPLTIIQKLPPRPILENKNILKTRSNIPNHQQQILNNNTNNYNPYHQNNNNFIQNQNFAPNNNQEKINLNENNVNQKITRIIDDQPRNSDEIDVLKNMNIRVQKIPNINHQLPKNQNLLYNNMNVIRPNLNMNNVQIQNNLNLQQSNNKKNQVVNDEESNENIPFQQNIVPSNIVSQPQLQQIPDGTIIGNIIIKNGKAYYINPSLNKNVNPNVNSNINYNNIHLQNNINQQQNANQIQKNNFYPQKQNISNNINNNGNQLNNPKPPKPVTNNHAQVKNIIKKKKLTRAARILKAKDSNDHKPALQHKVERNRPVYAIPPNKKRAISQGKPFNLINKYYDENYILEDDEEINDKNEEAPNIKIAQNISDDNKSEN